MYRGAVLDLDGTVYRGRDPIPGAPEAIERLRERGLALLFLSNNPTKSREAYVERLDRMGIEVEADEVLSAGTVTTRYLAEHHADDALFVVGSPGLLDQFEEAGLGVTGDPEAADALVASYDHGFGYDDMTDAYRAVGEGGAFVGSDPDVVIPAGNGRMVPGSGAIVNACAGVLEREPDHVLGKPSPETVEMAREAIGVPLEDCLVVGDRLNTDLAFGERAGMTTVLARTGVTDERRLAASEVEPDHVIDSLADVDTVLEG
ncbi:MAG: HAD-IIA family hydrolase [Haloarculaceae archaeon]